MAAKTLEEALYCANIDIEIKKAICVGPLFELTDRIEKAEKIIIDNLKHELRDYFAHEVQRAEFKGEPVRTLFHNIFKTISAVKGENDG